MRNFQSRFLAYLELWIQSNWRKKTEFLPAMALLLNTYFHYFQEIHYFWFQQFHSLGLRIISWVYFIILVIWNYLCCFLKIISISDWYHWILYQRKLYSLSKAGIRKLIFFNTKFIVDLRRISMLQTVQPTELHHCFNKSYIEAIKCPGRILEIYIPATRVFKANFQDLTA